MGVRQHLNELAARGLVTTTAENHQTRGRPAHYWQLTDAGHRQFPDAHDKACVTLITRVRDQFGDEALQKIILGNQDADLNRYRKALQQTESDLASQLSKLAELRSEEGFMAKVRRYRTVAAYPEPLPCLQCRAIQPALCHSECVFYQHCLPAGPLLSERTICWMAPAAAPIR